MPVAGECSAAIPAACGSISREPGRLDPRQAGHAVARAAALELVEAAELASAVATITLPSRSRRDPALGAVARRAPRAPATQSRAFSEPGA